MQSPGERRRGRWPRGLKIESRQPDFVTRAKTGPGRKEWSTVGYAWRRDKGEPTPGSSYFLRSPSAARCCLGQPLATRWNIAAPRPFSGTLCLCDLDLPGSPSVFAFRLLTQLVLLSAAAQREDGTIELAPNREGGAAHKVAGKLLRDGLIEEIHNDMLGKL